MRRLLTALIASALVSVTIASAAAASTTRVAFSGAGTFAAVLDPGTSTMSGTVLSVRGMVWQYTNAVGNSMLDGPDIVTINYDLDVATGLGELWGTDQVRPTAYADGGFNCAWHGTFAGGMPPFWTGKDVCHGYGSLRGWQVRYEMGTLPVISGYLFHPGL